VCSQEGIESIGETFLFPAVTTHPQLRENSSSEHSRVTLGVRRELCAPKKVLNRYRDGSIVR
jgi:hypothetical protein